MEILLTKRKLTHLFQKKRNKKKKKLLRIYPLLPFNSSIALEHRKLALEKEMNLLEAEIRKLRIMI